MVNKQRWPPVNLYLPKWESILLLYLGRLCLSILMPNTISRYTQQYQSYDKKVSFQFSVDHLHVFRVQENWRSWPGECRGIRFPFIALLGRGWLLCLYSFGFWHHWALRFYEFGVFSDWTAASFDSWFEFGLMGIWTSCMQPGLFILT